MWQQTQDGTIVLHPDGYITLTLNNAPFPTPNALNMAVFHMDMNYYQPCPVVVEQPQVKKRQLASSPETGPKPGYEKRRKCAQFRRMQVFQRRNAWDDRCEERKQARQLKREQRKQVTITENLRGVENMRKRKAPSPASCPLETCPKRIKLVKEQKKLVERFRKNEPRPRHFFESNTTDEETAASEISTVSGRRSRSPLTVPLKRARNLSNFSLD